MYEYEESDSYSDSESETEIASIEEFDFDIDQLKNPENNICLKCTKKFQSIHNLAVCKKCLYTLTITKTNAKKLYNLTDGELENFDYYSYKNAYGGQTYSYFLKEIRLYAIEKRFGNSNPSIDLYRNCVNILLVEAKDRKTKSRERGQKMIEARERNKEKKLQEEKILRNQLKKKLIKKLGKKIDLDDIECCNEYMDGERKDLDKVVANAKEIDKRKKKLEKALAKKGLEIRNDSHYCNQYINDGNYSVEEVVDMMEMMQFFATETNYFNLCKYYLDQKYQDAKEYGYWDGDRIELYENDKESAKLEALKKYLEKHSIKSVPKAILNQYMPKCQYCGGKAKFKMEPIENIECNYCGHPKHLNNSISLTICDFQCKKMNWTFIDNITTKPKKIRIIYALDNDSCKKCGEDDNYMAVFKGFRLNTI